MSGSISLEEEARLTSGRSWLIPKITRDHRVPSWPHFRFAVASWCLQRINFPKRPRCKDLGHICQSLLFPAASHNRSCDLVNACTLIYYYSEQVHRRHRRKKEGSCSVSLPNSSARRSYKLQVALPIPVSVNRILGTAGTLQHNSTVHPPFPFH